MLKKILKILVVLILIVFPIESGKILSKFSPYFDGNTFGKYILVCIVYTVIPVLLLLLVLNKSLPGKLLYGGYILFAIGVVMTFIFGLGAPPDFSRTMLQYPEREHFRYALLFLNAILFIPAFIFILRNRWNEFAKWNKWILLFLIPALAEMFWEFPYHYLYADNMKAWISQGKNAADFAGYYDDLTAIRTGALGRCFQYISVAWLAFILVQCGRMRKWAFAIIVFFCTVGLISGITILATNLHIPKGFEFLFIFFIPGVSCILLYWTGVALLTTGVNKKNQ